MQKQAMQRLTGGTKNQSSTNRPPVNTSSNKNISQPGVNRAAVSVPKKDNAKDILNRMK